MSRPTIASACVAQVSGLCRVRYIHAVGGSPVNARRRPREIDVTLPRSPLPRAFAGGPAPIPFGLPRDRRTYPNQAGAEVSWGKPREASGRQSPGSTRRNRDVTTGDVPNPARVSLALAGTMRSMKPTETASVAAETVAVIDIGASAVRLVVAELRPGQPAFIVEEASRGVSLGKDTFSTGRIGPATMEAALQALEGFKRLMDGYRVQRYRAVATSAVREAINADTFLDRVSVRTGLQVEIIDGSEESRLVYLAVRNQLRGHPALAAPHTLLVEVGGGSADITLLEGDRPKYSGVYALGSVRVRQSLARWSGTQERRIEMLARHIANVVGDIRREMPLQSASYMIAFGQRRPLRRPGTGRGAGGGRPRSAPRRVHRVLREGREAGRGGTGRSVRAVAGGRRDAGARAARVPRAAPADLGRRHHGAAGVAEGGPAGRPGRRERGRSHGLRRVRPAGARQRRVARREVPVRRRGTPRPSRFWRRACSTNCATSTA